MAPHDPLFKSLLRTFFAGFLRLVAPELAARLELTSTMFLDKEFPAFGPPAGSRVVDLLARVPLNDASGKAILVHVEVEARARRGIGERVRSYHRRIQARHEGQILSIVVFIEERAVSTKRAWAGTSPVPDCLPSGIYPSACPDARSASISTAPSRSPGRWLP